MIGSHPLLEDLNPDQQEAVAIAGGPVLVVAGAGSGKTRMLTHRIAYLIEEMGAPPDSILAITFTNKAAREMRERVGELLGATANTMWVSTFHSACARILRREAHVFGYRSSFSIYDRADSLRLIRQCLADLGLDSSRLSPRGLLNKISQAKNDLVDYETFLDRTKPLLRWRTSTSSITAPPADVGHGLRRSPDGGRGAAGSGPEVLEKYRQLFRHVLVDEISGHQQSSVPAGQRVGFQASEPVRVGDGDQSIYAFRGADYRNFSRFDDDFPEARRVFLTGTTGRPPPFWRLPTR